MNWEFIRDYPKSWDALKSWVEMKSRNQEFRILQKRIICFEYNNTQNTISIPFDSRFLYDFFDFQPLFVLVKQFDTGEFYAEITAYEKYDDSKAFAIEGHIETLYDGSDFNQGFFNNRFEAEKDGFMMAFQILESRLNGILKTYSPQALIKS